MNEVRETGTSFLGFSFYQVLSLTMKKKCIFSLFPYWSLWQSLGLFRSSFEATNNLQN